MDKGKALIQSKTFWFNILAVVTAIAVFFGFGEFEPSPETSQIITIIGALGNIYLRLITNQPIKSIR